MKNMIEAVKRQFPGISEDKAAVAALLVRAMRIKEKEELLPIGYEKYRQLEREALGAEIAGMNGVGKGEVA